MNISPIYDSFRIEKKHFITINKFCFRFMIESKITLGLGGVMIVLLSVAASIGKFIMNVSLRWILKRLCLAKFGPLV